MPDNLRVTVPITPNDSIAKLRPQKEPSTVEALTPDRVTPPNQRDQANQGNSFDPLMSRDSVFTKFIQQLRQTPVLSETLQKVMFDIFSRKEDIRTGGPVNTLLRQLSEGMTMDREALLQNLLFQQKNSTKFSGEVFQLLRGLEKQLEGTDFDLHLAHFLKAYDGYFSIEDTTKSIGRELDSLKQQIPRSSFLPIKEAAQKLELDEPVLNLEKNLTLLKEKMIPMLGEYISHSNDFGRARSTITLLVHDIARLNLSSREALVEKFENLLDYCRYGLNLPKEEIAQIQTLFAKEAAHQNGGIQNKLVDSLIKLLEDSSAQQHLSTSGTGQSVFKDLSTSLLMDQSVYMPFTHVFLPVNYQGHFMFAELWVEKDAPQASSGTADTEQQGKRLFLTFDIKDLGSFEAVIAVNGKSVSMDITCPAALPEGRHAVSDSLNHIFTQNGLNVDRLHVTSEQSLHVDKQILQKVYEGRNAINVTV